MPLKLVSEILTEVHNANTREEKKNLLIKYQSKPYNKTVGLPYALRIVFCPQIVWEVPIPVYRKIDQPKGFEYATLNALGKKIFTYTNISAALGHQHLTLAKKTEMLKGLLEKLSTSEALLVEFMAKKQLPIKGLDALLVHECFAPLLDYIDPYTGVRTTFSAVGWPHAKEKSNPLSVAVNKVIAESDEYEDEAAGVEFEVDLDSKTASNKKSQRAKWAANRKAKKLAEALSSKSVNSNPLTSSVNFPFQS